MSKSGLPAFLIKELKEVPPTAFFAVGFNLIVLTTDFILADYFASLASFLVATMAALVWESRCLLGGRFPGAVPGKARRILFRRRNLQWDPEVRGDSLRLAPLCGHTDLDLRSVSDLHLGRRTECTARRWRAQEDLLHQAFVGTEADTAGSGFSRSSSSTG
jgi:hypothetical protein